MDIKEHDILSKNLLKSLETDGDTQLIQTHISTIILSGELVYKLKKPVDFGFLDYSTLDKRHKNCLEEVRINEGFAPKLYLGVIPITGTIEDPRIDGEGRVLDYAVKMHRFAQSDQLDNIVEQEGIEIESMDKIAKVIAYFHKESVPVDAASDYGEPQRVLSPMLENFDLLQRVAAEHAFYSELASVIAWTHKQFENLKPLLQRRKKEGFVRECHGDMHLHNMALHEGELILFDAIEFNTYLNHIDVISDLAFLLMDLEYRGLVNHSRRLLNHYLELTGDYGGVALLDFYKTYRAMVRAKVAALRVAQEMEPDERRAVMDEVIRYIDLALSYTEGKEAFLAIMHGFSGSGKSTCALMMVEEYGALRIRSDVERIRMFERSDGNVLEEGIYTPDATKATYERLLELAISVYEGCYPVIVDATFLKQWQRRLFLELSSEVEVPFLIFDLQCDTKIMRNRIVERSGAGTDVSEADLDVLEKQMQTAEPLSNKEMEICFVVDCSSMESIKRAITAHPALTGT
ncbi:AAA family ATPase [Sulfurovum sp. CS9]|uniref:bifunctional aminoglycoside phosphotransferase/ATP-binding protein n=1 Tax=Sulfurovum sp. CS9 TaxID=3391146 RepID=UPI0039ED51C0